tara:strand:- start:645 stop:836 length:192 start_codon:yes stop_codon:yes gene_type:complete
MTKIAESSCTEDDNNTVVPAHVETTLIDYPKDAEKVNGRWAMLGLIALIGAYTSTGQIIPGIF